MAMTVTRTPTAAHGVPLSTVADPVPESMAVEGDADDVGSLFADGAADAAAAIAATAASSRTGAHSPTG